MQTYTVADGRVVAALVEVPGYPTLTVFSVYLTVGEGLSQRGLGLLGSVAVAAEAQRAPCIVGGASTAAQRRWGRRDISRELACAPSPPT